MTVNILGQWFGKLLVVGPFKSRFIRDRKRRFWLCRCVCGRKKWLEVSNLRTGNSVTCGVCSKGTHHKSNTSTYRIWANMLSRCRNKRSTSYYLYGGRGIRVCRRWLKFENFYVDMGSRPFGKSIERIDMHGNYCFGNCRWATSKEQAQNRRSNRLSLAKADEIRRLYSKGIIKAEIARQFGVSFSAVARVIDGSRWVSA